MEFKLDLAGIVLHIRGADEELFQDPGPLTPFLSDRSGWDREVTCGIVDELPETKGNCVYKDPGRQVYHTSNSVITYLGPVEHSVELAHIRAERWENTTDIQVLRSCLKGRIPPKILLQGLETEHLLVQNQGVLFHCSYIELDGGAILFTAPSGVGKSTQAELWRKFRGVKIINGDRAALRIRDDRVEAWGVPFSGSSGISHRSCLPVWAIVCLSQAPENTIRSLTGVRAFRMLWEGCSVHTWDREDLAICSETVSRVLERVPVFHLACTPDERAVLALEEALTQIGR